MEVTLNLPEEVYRQAESMARLCRRDITELLADTLQQSLFLAALSGETLHAISALSDDEVMALAQAWMDENQDKRLSLLLDRQREGDLTTPERFELADLMRIYQEGLVRKAHALQEAVKRGLRGPLES